MPVKFTPEISAGAVLQAITVAAMAMAYVFGVAGKSDESLNASKQLRADVTSQIADLKGTMSAGFATIQQQIAGLPDQRAQIADLIRRADHTDQKLIEVDGRINILTTNAAQIRSDLDGIMSASGRTPRRMLP